MNKMPLFGLLAGASLLLTVTACSTPGQQDDDVTVKPLEYPAAADSTGANKPREINAVNAVEDIKKMQPQM